MIVPVGFVGTFEPTEHSRALSALVSRVLDALNLKLITVADYVELPERYVSDALTNKRPLAFWRFFYRVPGFRRQFLTAIAEDEHCLVLDRDLVSMVVRVEQERPAVKAEWRETRRQEIA